MTEQWTANPGPQRAFLRCSAYEAFYGGAAGPGKSEALLVGALRFVENRNYTAIIFRRNYTELERTLITRSHDLYRAVGGKYNGADHVWRFPSGARIRFGHLQHETSVHDHQGAEYQYLGFDELTHFTESQYRYLLTRCRTSKAIPLRVRSGSNPGGPGHEWVFRRFGAWLDPSHPNRAQPGDTRWYAPDGSGGERETEPNHPDAFSRAFFPGRLGDNPKGDPNYGKALAAQDALTRAHLLDGDWLAKPAAGLFFKRAWFADTIVDKFDGDGRRCRYWDRAASIDGDWTVGARWCREPDGRFVVEDVIRFRGRPADVEARIVATAAIDGPDVTQVLEQDPGQAGVSDVDHLVRMLAGYDVRCVRPTGDKVTRFRPASALCERHMVRVVRAAWNAEWFAEHEAFPTKGVHDDQVDTTSGAIGFLAPPERREDTEYGDTLSI